MDQTPAEMSKLLDAAAAGSEEAARQLTERYGPLLRVAVRRWLDRRLRPMYDSVDFVQDVWASFFARSCVGDKFDHPSQLIAFLQVLARNKVIEANRQRLGSQKTNRNREQSLDAPEAQGLRLLDRQPSPSQIVSGSEEWNKFVDRQRPAVREILRRCGQGYSLAAICQELKICEETVQRVLRDVMAQLRPAG